MAKILEQNDLPLSYEIRIEGEVLSGEIEVISIDVTLEVNRIASAQLKISDGGVFGLENTPFSNSSSGNFVPGKAIAISLGYGSENEVVFAGVIVGQRMVVKRNTSFLLITCRDQSFTLTKSRSTNVQDNSKDDSFFQQLVSDAGLSVEAATFALDPFSLVQYNTSVWDYLIIRAEANNFFVTTDQNKVSVKTFDLSASPAYAILADQIAIEVDLELSGENTFSEYNFSSWDPKTQQKVVASGTMADSGSLGNITSNQLANDLSIPVLNKFTTAPLSSTELTEYSKSWISKSSLSKIQGRIRIAGVSALKPGELVELKGFGDRFDGNAFIAKIEQDCSEGDWTTVVYIGLHSRWHSSLSNVEEEDGMGIIPGVRGAQLATVSKIFEDPDGNYRVLVDLGAFQNSSNSNQLWARLSVNYASDQAGFFFFPEVGDEVLITFINGDPRFPVIVGSLYSSNRKPKVEPDEKNSTKAIHSKSGISLTFNETDKILTIATPGGNTITLDDKNKKISLVDINSNQVDLNDSGISLSSPKDIVLDSKGNVSIKAVSGISLSASGGDLKGEGLNVSLEAQVSMKAAGNASAEFSASGQTTLKGALVMIN